MALVKCPVCRTKMSSLAPVCPKCGFSHDKEAKIDREQADLYRKRRFSQRIYQLKMMSYVAMVIAMIGAIPMLWDYIKGLEQGNNVILLQHWGSYLVAIGFIFYLVIRVAMILTRRNYRSS
ncbi:MAG: hypothetical protein DWP95_00485 [Proteobacteria bacterium]|nr:MAG: hypothetical protein DWP95_00485 [Pseudomonadota bacterium]